MKYKDALNTAQRLFFKQRTIHESKLLDEAKIYLETADHKIGNFLINFTRTTWGRHFTLAEQDLAIKTMTFGDNPEYLLAIYASGETVQLEKLSTWLKTTLEKCLGLTQPPSVVEKAEEADELVEKVAIGLHIETEFVEDESDSKSTNSLASNGSGAFLDRFSASSRASGGFFSLSPASCVAKGATPPPEELPAEGFKL
jgi:hypothetical protein